MNGRVASRRLVTDVALAGAADALKLARVVVVLPLLSRSLGVEAYGVWSQLKVNSIFLGSLASLGMTAAVLRFVSGEHRGISVREGFNSALGTAVGCTVVLAALLLAWNRQAASVMFGDSDLSIFVAATCLYLLLEVVDLLVMAYLRATRQLGFHTTWITIEVAGEVLLVWTMVARGMSLTNVVFGIIGWRAVVVSSKLGRTWRQIGIAWPRASIILQYLAFGIPLALSGLGYLVVNYGDRYFISFFLGIGAVGIYAAAYAIGSLPIVLCTPIDYVMYPAIAAEWNAGHTSAATRRVETMLEWLVVLLVPIVAGLAVLARPIMVTAGTEKIGSAAPVAILVAFGFAIFYIGIVGERVLVLANRPRTVTAIYAGLALVNAGLNALLIPRLGLMGAAVATLASFVAYSAVTLALARKHCRFHFPISVFWKSLVAGAVAAIVALPLAADGLARISIAIVALGAAYGLTLLAVGGVRLSDLVNLVRGERGPDPPAVAHQAE